MIVEVLAHHLQCVVVSGRDAHGRFEDDESSDCRDEHRNHFRRYRRGLVVVFENEGQSGNLCLPELLRTGR